MNNYNFDHNRNKMLAIARGMLNGEINLIEGCRNINSLRFEIGDDPDDDVFDVFRAVDSETDHFPIGEIRKQYSETALTRIDAEMNVYIHEVKPDIVAGCKKLITLLVVSSLDN